MAATESTMLSLGTEMPGFRLPSAGGEVVSSDDFPEARGILVMFICNHCPFVKHIRDELVSLAREYQAKGIQVIAINANDWSAYPDDSPDKMAEEARRYGFPFPYLYDESQEVAKAYRAACTPDFFLFDADRRLVYRGQLDDSRPGNQIPITGRDLRSAMDALVAGQAVGERQKPSLGCNIKWRQGNAPEYFGTAP